MPQRHMSSTVIEQCLDANFLWSQILCRPAYCLGRAALFLDRDGAIVHEVNYLHRAQDVRLIPGAAEVIRRANHASIPIVVITNQAGIGRSYYGWEHFVEVQERMLADLAKDDARIDAVFACAHHLDARTPYDHPDHPARKPNPGMMYMARDKLGIDLARSWIVGDRAIDLRAGRNAGLAGGTHVRTGHGTRANERETALALARSDFHVQTAESILDLLAGSQPFDGALIEAQRR